MQQVRNWLNETIDGRNGQVEQHRRGNAECDSKFRAFLESVTSFPETGKASTTREKSDISCRTSI